MFKLNPITGQLDLVNSSGVTDHGALTGLGDDDHTQYALLAGRSSGQTLTGGTASGDDLTLQSTSNGTKGSILFGTSAYDELNNRLGIGTTEATFPLTFPSGSTGIGLYNTASQTTNWERGELRWDSNILKLRPAATGSGVTRNVQVGTDDTNLTVNAAGSPKFNFTRVSSTSLGLFGASYTMTASSGTQVMMSFTPTVNQSSTGGYTGLLINPTETAVGSGTKRLADFQVGSTSRFNVSNTGLVSLRGGLSTTLAKGGGTVSSNTTTVGNVGAGEDDLMSYSVPANMLGTDQDSIGFKASGTIANNANAKRIRVKFGSTTILDTGAAGIPVSSAIDWVIEGKVIRTGSATQKCMVTMYTDNSTFASYADYSTASETLSGAVTLKLTGDATSDNDIVQEIMTVNWDSAP